MEKHITLVGIVNIAYESLTLIGSFILFIIAYGFRYIMEFASRYDRGGMSEVPPEVMEIVPCILTIIGIFIFVFSIIGIIGSIGVIKRKEWGRITLLVISFFNLLHIPLGTILGVYSIWALLNDETIRLFSPVHQVPAEKSTLPS
jgi:hypothetical protein